MHARSALRCIRVKLTNGPCFSGFLRCFLNSVTQEEIRVPAELEMDAIALLHGYVSQPCRLILAGDS